VTATPVPQDTFRLRHGRTDARTFAAFGELFAYAMAHPGPQISVDCSGLTFCNGNLSAALSALQRQLTDHGKGLVLTNLRPGVRGVLSDTGLLGIVNQRPRASTIPLMRFSAGESTRFDLYAKKGLENKGLPRMSPGLEQQFFSGIHELFTNFEIHSQSNYGAWACGQLFPQMGKVEFTLVDHGIGIPARILERGFATSPHGAIAWAMTGTNTTRQGDVPGGLGLKILRSFISLNGGELTVASHNGFWREAGERVNMRPLVHPFPGTAVTVVVNTKDKQSYRLASEIKPGDIF
jgi:anti-anti-sigma regulatory factor